MRYHLKDLVIDTEARSVHRDTAHIKLPELSFDVLIRLIESAPNPVHTNVLSKDVWCNNVVSNETIAQRITLIRKALGDDPKNPSYIRTVRGVGYCIVSSVTELEVAAESSTDAENKARHVKSKSAKTQMIGFAAMLAFVAIASSSIWLMSTDTRWRGLTTSVKDPTVLSEADILVHRARAQLGVHKAKETGIAIELLRKSLKMEPRNFSARLSLSFALSANNTKFSGKLSQKLEAESLARALISEQPENSNAWVALAYSLDSQGRIDESLPAYQHAYQLDPGNASAMSSAAYVHLLQGELFAALQLEIKAKQVGGKSRYAEIQIAHLLELIEHPAAEKWQAQALSLNPGQIVILSEVARTHLRQGQPALALEVLSRIKGEDSFAPQVLQLRGRAQLSLGNIGQARQAFEDAADGAFFDIIALDALLGDTRPAEALINSPKLNEIVSGASPDERIQLAEVYSAMGQDERALVLISQGVSLGWRDIRWLTVSPFIGALMSSAASKKIIARMERELTAQRRLIENNNLIVSSI